MKASVKIGAVLMAAVIACVSLLGACGGGDGDGNGDEGGIVEPSTEKKVVTIGNLTDLTGAMSAAALVIDMTLHDAAEYFNEQNFIPGVELKVIDYDGSYDPSKDIPGYERLKERGADVIWTPVPATPLAIRPLADEDHMLVFAASASPQSLIPPGWAFSPGSYPMDEGYTILKWIAENDWDYKTKGPAKVGGATWPTPYTMELIDGAKKYAEEHPDQFEWVGKFVSAGVVFTWGSEVQALRDCDYVLPPTIMVNFVKQYRDAGYDGKIVGTSAHLAFVSVISDAKIWDELDGAIFLNPTRWWNEEGTMINLTKEILNKNHPDGAKEIMGAGSGYLAITNAYQLCEIIRNAVAAAGVEKIDSADFSQAIYDAAESYEMEVDGVKQYSFSPTKRTAPNYVGIYRLDASKKDIFRQGGWYPMEFVQ
ncbi:MAG: ABC transporter substrate-binding protein [Chloroflexi bacterium]|nr:ABC transporter substrate-binding protein [Chloroflexota bacterium]